MFRVLSTQGLRLAAATTLLAVAGGFFQTAQAAPFEGRGGHAGQGGGGGLLMGHPRMLDRVLDSVNASTDQRTQIKAIAAAAQTDLKAIHAQGKTLREQSAALFTQTTVDARAAEALRAQTQALHDQGSKRMLQAMLDVSRVLTPEQRQTLAKKMAERRAMMERHHSERESLDAPRPR
jgi:periplasmic protein CpxP/Spy